MSSMKEKMGNAYTNIKEKTAEAGAKAGEVTDKMKAELQENWTKATHPMSHEAWKAADAKEHEKKHEAKVEKERKILTAKERALDEKEQRHAMTHPEYGQHGTRHSTRTEDVYGGVGSNVPASQGSKYSHVTAGYSGQSQPSQYGTEGGYGAQQGGGHGGGYGGSEGMTGSDQQQRRSHGQFQ